MQFTSYATSVDFGMSAAILVLAVQLCFLQRVQAPGDGTRLFLLSLLPYPDDTNTPAWSEGPSLFLAAELAVKHINNRSDVLGDYRLELIQGDSGCDISTKSATAFVEHALNSDKQIVAIIGPACSVSGAIISRLTGTNLIGLINVHIAGSPLLKDRIKYPFSFGMLASNEIFADTLTALMVENSWNRIATLYDESWLTAVEVALERKVSNLPSYAINITSVVAENNLPLSDIREAGVRVTVILVRPDFLYRILCLAYHEDFRFPRYQFVIVGMVNKLKDFQFRYNRKDYVCNREKMEVAMNGSIVIDYRLLPPNTNARTDIGLSHADFIDQYTTLISKQNDSESGLSQSFLGSSYYDAVWSLALALNSSTESLNKMNFTLSQYGFGYSDATRLIQQQILKLDFTGVSGRVHFSSGTGYIGSRVVDIHQYRNATKDLVAYYNESDIIQISTADYINDSFEVELIPARASLPLAVIFLILIGVAFIAVATSHIISIIYRKKRPIRSSQPKLNQLGYVGCYAFVLAVLSYILAEAFPFNVHTYCILYHMLNTSVSIGSGLLAGTVCAKTWRIYKIFVSWKDPGKLISDSVLATFVLVYVAGDIVVCTLWIILDPFQLREIDRSRMGAQENVEIVVREICISKNYRIWFALLTAYNGLILFVSLFLAYRCHHQIPRAQREFRTNSTIVLGCALSVTLSLGFAVYFIIPEIATFTLEFITICIMLTLVEFYFLFFVFLPPMFQLLNHLRKEMSGKKHP